ncbi:MAG: SGNH/GDSL hydrolase family protein, partial [Flavobacteriaceae bacterium]
MPLTDAIKRLLLIFLIFSQLSCTDRAKGQDNSQEENRIMINYLALGDSYTIGQGVNILERWPNQLIVGLEENNFEVERFQIIAQTGWTTGNLITAVNESEIGEFDL